MTRPVYKRCEPFCEEKGACQHPSGCLAREEAVRLCSVEGCNEKHRARGWCIKHYMRWYTTGTLEVSIVHPKDGEPHEFLEKALEYRGQDCLLWPYGKGHMGHGMIWLEGRMKMVNRVVCQRVHGDPPTPKHHAAHFCGVAPCCNPQHIRWATQSENEMDKIIHGTQRNQFGMSKKCREMHNKE